MATTRPHAASLTRESLTVLAGLLCDRDRAEVLALQPDNLDTTASIAHWIDHVLKGLAAGGEAWVVSLGDEPVAAGGLVPVPGRAAHALSWCVGSARKREAGPLIFKIAARVHETWQKDGVRRFQCTCLDSGDPSDWLMRLGYQREGRLRQVGRGGEDFLLWGRVHGS